MPMRHFYLFDDRFCYNENPVISAEIIEGYALKIQV